MSREQQDDDAHHAQPHTRVGLDLFGRGDECGDVDAAARPDARLAHLGRAVRVADAPGWADVEVVAADRMAPVRFTSAPRSRSSAGAIPPRARWPGITRMAARQDGVGDRDDRHDEAEVEVEELLLAEQGTEHCIEHDRSGAPMSAAPPPKRGIALHLAEAARRQEPDHKAEGAPTGPISRRVRTNRSAAIPPTNPMIAPRSAATTRR